ncbi:Cytoplasmic thioredoxin isoenzyme 2 [Cladochytrium tenue]|nr:Cytoplasmic thioredoxin isoenzyme 2 [Cladochytrium tenue]
MVKEVASVDEFVDAVKSGKLVVVDYFATWCGPCKMVAPKFSQLADKYPDAVFLKLDVDEFPEIAEQAGVTAMPTFQLFKEGTRVGDEIRGVNVAAIEKEVQKFIA